jgi:hypothetical protein
MRALGASATGSERLIARDTQRELMQTQMGQNAVNAGVQNLVGGLSDIGGTVGYAAALSSGPKPSSPDIPGVELPNKVEGLDLSKDPFSRGAVNKGVDVRALAEMNKPKNGPALGSLTPQEEEEALRMIQNMYEKGGAVKTPGEFNHDSNPIYMVQDGDVIGEMTGGEYILNPKQAKKISAQSKYFRNLLKTKRFK